MSMHICRIQVQKNPNCRLLICRVYTKFITRQLNYSIQLRLLPQLQIYYYQKRWFFNCDFESIYQIQLKSLYDIRHVQSIFLLYPLIRLSCTLVFKKNHKIHITATSYAMSTSKRMSEMVLMLSPDSYGSRFACRRISNIQSATSVGRENPSSHS